MAWEKKKASCAQLSLQLLFWTGSALTPLEMQLHTLSKTKCGIVFVVDNRDDHANGHSNGHGDGHDDGHDDGWWQWSS